MELSYLEKSEYSKWNQFVDESNEGSIFSKSWYLDALQIDYKILTIKLRDEIKAGIVLAKNEINIYSNPMFDKYLGVLYSNILGDKHKVTSTQYKYLIRLTQELKKIGSFDYYFHPNFKNHIPMHWQNFVAQVRYTYIIDNSNSLDLIYNNFQKKIIKKNIQYAQNRGVTIKRDIDFETFWDLVNKTYLRQGSKAPFSKERIKKYIQILKSKDCFESFGAFEGGKCVAVCGLVYEEKSSYLLFNGIDTSMIRGANALMIWESIKYFHNKCAFYDFEGSMLPGAEPFFRKFGGELRVYYNICNYNAFNFLKKKVKMFYKKIRFGR